MAVSTKYGSSFSTFSFKGLEPHSRWVAYAVAVLLICSCLDAVLPNCDFIPEYTAEICIVAALAMFELWKDNFGKIMCSTKSPKSVDTCFSTPVNTKTTKSAVARSGTLCHPLAASTDPSSEDDAAAPGGTAAGEFHVRLQAAAKHGDLDKAKMILQSMKVAGARPTVMCYSALISACAKAGDADGAEDWLETLIGANLGKPNTICFNITISACAKSGNVARAEAWIPKMRDLGVEPDVMSFNAVIDACARAAQVNRAEEWLSHMCRDNVSPNVVSYSSVLHACAKVGSPSRAEKWLSQMEAEGVEPNAICYNALINACAKAGDNHRASDWIDRMTENGVQPTVNSYSCIIDRLAKTGAVHAAEAWIQKMAKAGVEADLVTYNMILGAYSRAGDAERASATLSHA
jgi:pentatricopeptide repeat protein